MSEMKGVYRRLSDLIEETNDAGEVAVTAWFDEMAWGFVADNVGLTIYQSSEAPEKARFIWIPENLVPLLKGAIAEHEKRLKTP